MKRLIFLLLVPCILMGCKKDSDDLKLTAAEQEQVNTLLIGRWGNSYIRVEFTANYLFSYYKINDNEETVIYKDYPYFLKKYEKGSDINEGQICSSKNKKTIFYFSLSSNYNSLYLIEQIGDDYNKSLLNRIDP